jgi:hypothetical protein
MKKKYLIEFTLIDGSKEEVEFITDRLEWSIDQWCRNRKVITHKVLSENSNNSKQMLLG